MLLMFEKGIRSGITQLVKPFAKTSIKNIKSQYNLDEKSTYMQYLDEHNL